MEGTVSDYVPPHFTLTTIDYQIITAQFGSMNYMEQIGLNLKDGDAVVVTGYYDVNGSRAIGQITIQSAGYTFTLRDDIG